MVLAGLVQLTTWAQVSGSVAGESLPNAPSGGREAADSPSGRAGDMPLASAPVSKDQSDDLLLGEEPDNHLGFAFARHLASDQRDFWTAPAHFRVKDLKWITPFVGITTGVIAGDSWISKQIPLSKVQASKTFSEYATYSLISAGGGDRKSVV